MSERKRSSIKLNKRSSISNGIAAMDYEDTDNKLYGKIGKLIKIIVSSLM